MSALPRCCAFSGYSRIPVLDRDTLAPKFQLKVVGLIHVKDLLLIDLVHEVPLKALMPLIGRQVLVVDDDRPLPEILDEFRTGASQFAVVQSYSDDEDGIWSAGCCFDWFLCFFFLHFSFLLIVCLLLHAANLTVTLRVQGGTIASRACAQGTPQASRRHFSHEWN